MRSSGSQRQHVLQDLLGGLPRDLVAAQRAVRHADRGVQQPQVVVDFGDGADRRARAAAGGLLLDRNGRAQPVDGIHIGPLHLVQELARVGRKRFDVAPLPFRVDRVEGQRGFARSAQPGDHGKAVARNFDVDVLQIVLARAVHRDSFEHSTYSGEMKAISYCGAC